MNIRDLRYVIAVAETGHFGRAAEACHVSQPTLSVQIRKLEAELEVTLFERNGRQLLVTPAGEAVVAEARRVLSHVDAIGEIARGFIDPLAGPFNLGIIATLGPCVAAQLLDRLEQQAPRLQLTLREDLTGNLVPALQTGQLNAAIIATEETGNDLQDYPLFHEPFLIGHAPGHPLGQRAVLRVQDLSQGPLLLLTEGNCLRDQTLSLCDLDTSRDAQSGPLLASSLETAIAVAASGRGITLVPALSARRAKGLTLRNIGDGPNPIDGLPPHRTIRLITRRRHARPEACHLTSHILCAIATENNLPLA